MNTDRGICESNIVVITQGGAVTLHRKTFFARNKFFKTIRMQPDEYQQLKLGLYTHFNLQWTGHKVGKLYAFSQIIKSGSFKGRKEILPILSFENCPLGKCLEVQNNVPYSALQNFDFTHSLPTIQSVDQLKQAILKRYTKSMPALSKEEILSMGVAITKLKIVGKLEKVVY